VNSRLKERIRLLPTAKEPETSIVEGTVVSGLSAQSEDGMPCRAADFCNMVKN